MKEISLTKGYVALVDDEDFAELSKHRWFAASTNGGHYASRREYVVGGKGKSQQIYMHRFLLGATKGIEVDHISGETLDNRRQNLRLCTHQENIRNRRNHRRATYKGVQLVRRGARSYWVGRIYVNGKGIHLGYFPTAEDAARRYNEAAVKFFGEFACPNG